MCNVEVEVKRMFDNSWKNEEYPHWVEYNQLNNNNQGAAVLSRGMMYSGIENLKLHMIFSVDGGSFDWRNYGVIVKLICGDEEWWKRGTQNWKAALNLSLSVFVMKEDYKNFHEEISPIYNMIYQVCKDRIFFFFIYIFLLGFLLRFYCVFDFFIYIFFFFNFTNLHTGDSTQYFDFFSFLSQFFLFINLFFFHFIFF